MHKIEIYSAEGYRFVVTRTSFACRRWFWMITYRSMVLHACLESSEIEAVTFGGKIFEDITGEQIVIIPRGE